MSPAADYQDSSLQERENSGAMERRIFNLMCATVVLSVAASALIAPWRVTSGLLIGGALSLLNYRWLSTSIAAAMGEGTSMRRVRTSRFVLRYFVIAAVIGAAYYFDVTSLVAALFGLCSFVVAALAEAFMQTLIAIFHREGN